MPSPIPFKYLWGGKGELSFPWESEKDDGEIKKREKGNAFSLDQRKAGGMILMYSVFLCFVLKVVLFYIFWSLVLQLNVEFFLFYFCFLFLFFNFSRTSLADSFSGEELGLKLFPLRLFCALAQRPNPWPCPTMDFSGWKAKFRISCALWNWGQQSCFGVF